MQPLTPCERSVQTSCLNGMSGSIGRHEPDNGRDIRSTEAAFRYNRETSQDLLDHPEIFRRPFYSNTRRREMPLKCSG